MEETTEQLLERKLKMAEIYVSAMKSGIDAAIKAMIEIHHNAIVNTGDTQGNLVTQTYLLGMQHMLEHFQQEAAEHDWDETLISMKVEVVKQHDEKHPRGE